MHNLKYWCFFYIPFSYILITLTVKSHTTVKNPINLNVIVKSASLIIIKMNEVYVL